MVLFRHFDISEINCTGSHYTFTHSIVEKYGEEYLLTAVKPHGGRESFISRGGMKEISKYIEMIELYQSWEEQCQKGVNGEGE